MRTLTRRGSPTAPCSCCSPTEIKGERARANREWQAEAKAEVSDRPTADPLNLEDKDFYDEVWVSHSATGTVHAQQNPLLVDPDES